MRLSEFGLDLMNTGYSICSTTFYTSGLVLTSIYNPGLLRKLFKRKNIEEKNLDFDEVNKT